MDEKNTPDKQVILLAYFHRYGWIAALMVCAAIWFDRILWIFSTGFLIFSVWSFVGYKCKWKHIYCSFQDAYHQKMTPNNIQWYKVKKSDAYGLPLLFFVLGLALFFFLISRCHLEFNKGGVWLRELSIL